MGHPGHGITTLGDVKDRCRINDETGCWEWSLTYSGRSMPNPRWKRSTLPVAWYGKEGRTVSVLRIVWMLSHAELPRSHVVWRTCGNELCCKPGHLISGTHKERGEWIAKAGEAKMTPSHKAACRAASFKLAHLTREQAAYVLASDKTGRALAAELGVSDKVISRIRTGKAAYARPAAGSVWALAA